MRLFSLILPFSHSLFHILTLSFFLGSLLLAPGSLLADSSSESYALAEDRFTGGGGSASSESYQIVETSFESFSGDSLSSANYALAPKVGIDSAAHIVTINSVSPANYSRHYADENATFTVSALDPDSDHLEYRATQDGTVKAGPQASHELSWAWNESDLGRHTIRLEVIDPDGTVAKQQAAYVFRRAVK